VNVPLVPLANIPRFNAMTLPQPPIVSPVESLALDGIDPNPTIPYRGIDGMNIRTGKWRVKTVPC
jgi:hypothetical protein